MIALDELLEDLVLERSVFRLLLDAVELIVLVRAVRRSRLLSVLLLVDLEQSLRLFVVDLGASCALVEAQRRERLL